ncbi:hypothetical protein EV679_0338 [Kerstersia gyiorum]|uniref:Toxin-antitoxin system HicB family antitoxin n=1 Tax=Kerstersia gyiorum TaxID=206506 RepID=A0A4Q7MYC6_9BURK|nr:hypothetical protein [Kerstersia gyiorum]KAB0544168.1 hypothetical protein F7P85_06010 [Kerstersia gyiorum]RZS73150.1 hypothetical protein EV679_0338 [Kerstersia gyiorum]
MKRITFMTRLTPANHQWLSAQAKKEDRSMTWLLDQLVTQARSCEPAKENAPLVAASEALDQ